MKLKEYIKYLEDSLEDVSDGIIRTTVNVRVERPIHDYDLVMESIKRHLFLEGLHLVVDKDGDYSIDIEIDIRKSRESSVEKHNYLLQKAYNLLDSSSIRPKDTNE